MVIILCIYTLWVIQQAAEYSCAQIICYVLKRKANYALHQIPSQLLLVIQIVI